MTLAILTTAQWGADEWSAAGTIAQAIITLVALVFAYLAAKFAAGQVRHARDQVDEARRSRETQERLALEQSRELAERDEQLRRERARPFVVVDLETSSAASSIFNVVIENIGQTLAKNVKVTFDPPLVSTLDDTPGHKLADSVLLTKGIPAMPPGKRIEAIFDVAHQRYSAGLPMTYTVTVEFDDYQDRRQEPLEYVLDLTIRYGITYVETKTVHDVAKILKDIQKDVHRWTQHQSGIRVWTRDEDAYIAARQRQLDDRSHPESSDDTAMETTPVIASEPSHDGAADPESQV